MSIIASGAGYWELGLHGFVWPHGTAVSYGNGP